MVFPEATTVNQTALLPFKKGAFAAGKPVQMCRIQYDNTYFDHSDASCSMGRLILKSLTGIYSKVTITYLGAYVPNELEIADPLLYAENVRSYYADVLKQPKIDLTFQDKYFFTGRRFEIGKCSDLWKQEYGDQCKVKNGWVIKK